MDEKGVWRSLLSNWVQAIRARAREACLKIRCLALAAGYAMKSGCRPRCSTERRPLASRLCVALLLIRIFTPLHSRWFRLCVLLFAILTFSPRFVCFASPNGK